MSSNQNVAVREPNRGGGSIWPFVLGVCGIGLVRMLIGFFAWFAVTMVALEISGRMAPDIEVLGDSPKWFFGIVAMHPVLTIASLVFLPLWKRWVTSARRNLSDLGGGVAYLLPLAIALQLLVSVVGGIPLGALNFLVAVLVCFLVTAHLEEQTGRQFLHLLIAGSHGIIFFTLPLLLDSNTPLAGWEFKAAAWLGVIPSIVLMIVLFIRCLPNGRKITGAAENLVGEGVDESSAIDSMPGSKTSSSPASGVVDSSVEDSYFYVGPGNEPVGPISLTVLLQLRRSGVIADDTFVARERESDWRPLNEYFQESDTPAT